MEPTTTERLRASGIPEQYHPFFAERGLGGLAEKMGIVFEEMGPEHSVARMPVEGNTQPAGLLHGGAHLVLAETLGSIASNIAAGPGKMAVGVDISATHQRAITSGWVTGTCTALHLGGSLCVHEVVMRDDAGRRLSTARITNMVVDRRG
ncbi:hotdog fold thioesterase [Rothia sp. AR01]|uniref:Hotdog fold thioesterase n=1 Tax=Rothia santali TaxID=2949643 RepID=A0A9X2HG44_9MICC|nr:hotdog fold thioesterase [Rothia santali]MCP3426137.1 hotdog fold thioesterase [Rothia santali]